VINTIMLSAMAFVQNTIGYTISKLREERGQDIMEYVVLIGAVAIVAAGALLVLDQDGIWEEFTGRISDCLTFDMDACSG
jgi:hypothetical protein